MSCERQLHSICSPSLSGLTLNLSQASIPTGPTLLPQFSPSYVTEELSSFVGENPVISRGSVPGNERESRDSELGSTEGAHILDVLSPTFFSSKSNSSTAVKSNQRPRYVLPPDINTFGPNTLATSCNNTPSNSSLNPSLTVFGPKQLSPSLSSSSQNDIQTPQLPTTLKTTGQYSHCVHTDNPILTSPPIQRANNYHPVEAYWFYSTIVENIFVWWPFSRHDSHRIEMEFLRSYYTQSTPKGLLTSVTDVSVLDKKSTAETNEIVVQVDGGRYDVYLTKRERRSVYWDESPGEVRRATWFYKPQGESRVLPFSERTCDLLEAQYKFSVEQGQWGKRFDLPSEDKRGGSDVFIFYSPESMIQYLAWPYDLTSTSCENVVAGTSSPFIQLDSSQLSQEMSLTGQLFEGRVCYIQRGLNEQLMEQIDEGDYKPVDQLFFIVHGIGSIYNLKGQGLIDCVNDMRRIAKRLSQTHFSHHPYRVEFLPILWHDELHSDTVTGLDKQLEQITLGSIPKLRQFTNDSLMDILFYTSSKYSQLIVNTVAREIKRLRELFLSRNPNFSGNISIIGHSLGAVISFDLLCHQTAFSSSCSATVDQSLILLSSTINNNSSNHSGIYVQSKTTSNLDHVGELPGELMTCQSTNNVCSSTTTVTTNPAATITVSCTKDSTSLAIATSISENISSLSSTISSYASSSTCPPNDHTNDENKSEHNSSNTSDAGQNDMGEWSIVDYYHHDNQRNHNRSKCNSNDNNNNNNNTNKRQSEPVFRLSFNNISQLNKILLHNGLSVDKARSILQSIIDLNKVSQMKSNFPEDLENEINNVEDINSSTITSDINPDQFPNIVTTTSNSTLTPFWLENYCFCLNKCSNNNSTSNSDFVSAGFGITLPNYPQLGFTISGLYTLGSPIPLFLTARGIKTLSREFHLPTCSTFYNIFHPFDPVAYRMETLIDSEFQKKSVLIPHHKGRKRIHLQLKDNLSWVGSELKSKLYSSVQSTWRSLHDFALAHKFISTSDEPVPASAAYGSDNSYGDELESYQNAHNFTDNRNDVVTTTYRNVITQDLSFNSQLNQGRRIDYVLQEAALESFNEYLFALTSHATYWDSVDTVLFILTEAYSEQGVLPSMAGQKNIPQCTIHARALSPPVGSSSIQPLLNPSLPTDFIANVSTDYQVPSSQQSDRSVSLNLFNQNQTSDITTNIDRNIVSSFTKTTTIPVHLQFSSCVSPSIIPATINSNFVQTVTSSYNQTPLNPYYSSADSPSSHVLPNISTQKYATSQALTCISQDKGSNSIQTQQSHYSSIPVYTHRKETALTSSTINPVSNFCSPSFVQYYPPIIPTTSGIINHSVPLVPVSPSVSPDPLNTPVNTFTSTAGLQGTFYSAFQAAPLPLSQQHPPPSYIHYN
ncbi:hypothetical protein MN116_005644 [Schistosoma mekongi]|uniref:DDHD domain-containing protein n=1 Tax=Schistosoma mekongi TaxID=38744 RepID=A0AAE1ZBG8_SCHME|nr:hypothetical protein MN116_005644 [Schistosoma mekongi]